MAIKIRLFSNIAFWLAHEKIIFFLSYYFACWLAFILNIIFFQQKRKFRSLDNYLNDGQTSGREGETN
jgi:hypothetical protein